VLTKATKINPGTLIFFLFGEVCESIFLEMASSYEFALGLAVEGPVRFSGSDKNWNYYLNLVAQG
jgi:hypothetical protein